MHRSRRERMRDATRIDVDWLEAGSVLLFAVLAASFWIAIGLLCAGRFRVLPLAVSCLAGAGLTFGVVLAVSAVAYDACNTGAAACFSSRATHVDTRPTPHLR